MADILQELPLYPGIGIGPLRFGMTRSAIEALLGPPDLVRIFREEDEDSEKTQLMYNALKFKLEIYENHGGRLGYIRTKHPGLTYNNQRLLEQPVRTVQGILSDLIREWEVDDYEFFITYFNAEWWIELREDYGRVESLDMGVRFKNEDEYDWPAAVPAAISDSLTQAVPPPAGTGYA